MRKTTCIFFVKFFLISILAGCSAVNQNTSELDDLKEIIEIVLDGSKDELISKISFTQTECTTVEGLGGPPKCRNGEADGAKVEVLPVLGPEGFFIRKEEIDTWDGLDISRLYVVYEVSDSAYSDPNYPAGDYAIVFTGREGYGSTALQVRNGQIIRIDFGLENPPMIQRDDIKRILLDPNE